MTGFAPIRRTLRRAAPLAALAACLVLAACNGSGKAWHGTNITGAMPDLQFTMLRANDGKPVTAADYRGKIALLYFGYTNCPDICPTTLANLAETLRRLGPKAKNVRVLFVSVDPDRDTLPVLKAYVNAFSPQMDGLRGSENAIAALARRYRVAYSRQEADGDDALRGDAFGGRVLLRRDRPRAAGDPDHGRYGSRGRRHRTADAALAARITAQLFDHQPAKPAPSHDEGIGQCEQGRDRDHGTPGDMRAPPSVMAGLGR